MTLAERKLRRRVGWLLAAAAGASSCTPFPPDAPGAPDAGDTPGQTPPTEAASEAGDGGPPCDPDAAFGPASPVPGLDLATTKALSVSGVRLSPNLEIAYLAALLENESQTDLFTASRPDPTSAFSHLTRIPGVSAPRTDQLDPTVSGDGRIIVFSRGQAGDNITDNLYGGLGYPPLAGFTGVHSIDTLDDPSTAIDESPFLREDGRVLYFASSRVSSNKTDIYRAAVGDAGFDAGFVMPVSLSELNTQSSEVSPVVTPDELTIFFASDRIDMNAQGVYDILMGTRGSTTEPFSNVRNVQEVNSQGLDLPTFVTSDGCTLYFTSSRDGNQQPYVATKRHHP